MTCYQRHLTSLFDTLGLQYDKADRARVDTAIRAVFGFGPDAHCPEIWASIKALSPQDREELPARVAALLSGEGSHDSVTALWEEFLASGTPAAADAVGATYEAWHFGTGGEMADRLLELVLAGGKRATAGALWAYEHEGEAVPTPGEFNVITDGSGRARCVLRTTECEVVPFNEVGADHAAAEGEGDLSLEYWREGHWHYFSLDLATFGREATQDMPVVCERFEVVYP